MQKPQKEKMVVEQESWQVSGDAAEIYEQFWVPAMLGQWAPQMADAVKIVPEDRVLDAAYGTGVVAREAADRVAAAGQVTGVDINEGMLAVARRIRPEIDWRLGDAMDLPFDNASYDVVTCQFSLSPEPQAPRSLVVKLSPTDPQILEAMQGNYRREGYFYTEFAAKRNLPIPHCYYGAFDIETGEGVLLLEDLSHYRLVEFVTGCVPQDVEKVIRALASIHGQRRSTRGMLFLKRGRNDWRKVARIAVTGRQQPGKKAHD